MMNENDDHLGDGMTDCP